MVLALLLLLHGSSTAADGAASSAYCRKAARHSANMRCLLLLLLRLPLHYTNAHRLRSLRLLLQQPRILLQPCRQHSWVSIDAAAVTAAVPSCPWC
jgi:hypothetical protein